MVNGFRVRYIEALPMPVVDLTPIIVVILVVVSLGLLGLVLLRRMADQEIRNWPQ